MEPQPEPRPEAQAAFRFAVGDTLYVMAERGDGTVLRASSPSEGSEAVSGAPVQNGAKVVLRSLSEDRGELQLWGKVEVVAAAATAGSRPPPRGWIELANLSPREPVLVHEGTDPLHFTHVDRAWGSAGSKGFAKLGAEAVALVARMQYTVENKSDDGVQVRAGFDTKSPSVGKLKHGEVVECLESRVNGQGATRIRFKGRLSGWASLMAGDGSTQLKQGSPEEARAVCMDTPMQRGRHYARFELFGAAEQQAAHELFESIDKDGNGSLSRHELSEALHSNSDDLIRRLEDAGMCTAQHVFEQLDADGDGVITAEEFAVLCRPVTRGTRGEPRFVVGLQSPKSGKWAGFCPDTGELRHTFAEDGRLTILTATTTTESNTIHVELDADSGSLHINGVPSELPALKGQLCWMAQVRDEGDEIKIRGLRWRGRNYEKTGIQTIRHVSDAPVEKGDGDAGSYTLNPTAGPISPSQERWQDAQRKVSLMRDLDLGWFGRWRSSKCITVESDGADDVIHGRDPQAPWTAALLRGEPMKAGTYYAEFVAQPPDAGGGSGTGRGWMVGVARPTLDVRTVTRAFERDDVWAYAGGYGGKLNGGFHGQQSTDDQLIMEAVRKEKSPASRKIGAQIAQLEAEIATNDKLETEAGYMGDVDRAKELSAKVLEQKDAVLSLQAEQREQDKADEQKLERWNSLILEINQLLLRRDKERLGRTYNSPFVSASPELLKDRVKHFKSQKTKFENLLAEAEKKPSKSPSSAAPKQSTDGMEFAQYGMCRFEGGEARGLGKVTIEQAVQQCMADPKVLFFDIKEIGDDGKGVACAHWSKLSATLENMPALSQDHVEDKTHQTWRKTEVAKARKRMEEAQAALELAQKDLGGAARESVVAMLKRLTEQRVAARAQLAGVTTIVVSGVPPTDTAEKGPDTERCNGTFKPLEKPHAGWIHFENEHGFHLYHHKSDEKWLINAKFTPDKGDSLAWTASKDGRLPAGTAEWRCWPRKDGHYGKNKLHVALQGDTVGDAVKALKDLQTEGFAYGWSSGEAGSAQPGRTLDRTTSWTTRLVPMLFDAISHGRTLWGQPVEDLDSFIDVMDQNHDGLISRSELLDVLKRLDVGVMESQLERLVHSIDANRDGEIELEELT